MASLIKLANGKYLNPHRIAWMYDISTPGAPGTRVYFSGRDDDYMNFIEPPEEILALINPDLRTQS